MQFRKRGSFAVKLMSMMVASSGLILIVMIIFNYSSLKKSYLSEAEQAAKNLSKSIAQQVSLLLASAENATKILAPIVGKYLFSEVELTRFLEDAIKNKPEIFGMGVAFEPHAFKPELYYFMPYLYRQGDTIKPAFLGSPGYDYFNWKWYAAPKEVHRGLWSEPYQELINETVVCTFAEPFYRTSQGQKQFQGEVTASINLQWLQDIVASAKIFDHGYAFLLSRTGVFVTVPKKEWIMNLNIFFAATITDNPELQRIGQKMIEGGEGFVRIKDFLDYQDAWLYFAPFPVSGFSMGVVIPERELLAGLYRLNKRLIFICLVGLLFLVVVAMLISRKVTGPIRLLERSAAAIAQGNLNLALPPPATRDEIGSLTNSFKEMQEALKEYIANLAATTASKERIESELKIAHSIQMNFLPKKFPPLPVGKFVEVATFLAPAREVGGDLYDYFLVNNRHIFFMVGDVSGKGVPAALLMAVTKTLLKGLTEVGLQPSQVLAKVNHELASENDSMMFVSSFCGILDLETGELTYSNAGHNPPILLRPGQEPQWLPVPEGFFLGVFEEAVYHTRRIKLLPNDLILAYTDGIVEAVNVHERFYSKERLMITLKEAQYNSAEGLVKTVKDSVATFSQGVPQADDITILALRFKGYKIP